ncbi:STY4526/YPO1902 family pathogenicity island replication protein [Thiolapillus sp.]|uniref:STY4526/YPO1902 family pathogenicity island replication protein n=1 Tax=Thiolapillus sp. TaxID=2017437 RepID=UPI003AF46C4D
MNPHSQSHESHISCPLLNRMVLDHLINSIASGDHTIANQLGIPPAMIAPLTDLRPAEINRLAELRGCVRITLDVPALSRLLDRLMQDRSKEQLVQELIRRGAPQPMLYSLFQLTSREATALRYVLGLPGSPGRTREPTEEEEHRVWKTMQKLAMTADRMTPQDWVDLQDETGVPLRVLWAMVNEWREPTEVAV